MPETPQHKIVILASDRQRRDALRSLVAGWGYVPFIFEKERICLENIIPLQPDLLICGPLLPPRAFRFLTGVKATGHRLPVLIWSTGPDIRDFVALNGFLDVTVLDSGNEPARLRVFIRKALEESTQGNGYCPVIVGDSPAMVKIKQAIAGLNGFEEPLVILGEAGTGKELVARAIHHRSARSRNPFVKVAAAALADNVDMAALPEQNSPDFGFERLLQDGNAARTLLIEEVGALPPAGQARLLHFFEQKKSLPGARTPETRIIATSTVALDRLVAAGRVRKDLYYRLNVMGIEIPPLRRRPEDIPLLADFFMDRFCLQAGRSCFELPGKTRDAFRRHCWPGNVAELEDLIKTAVLHDGAGRLTEQLKRRRHEGGRLTLVDSARDITAFLEPDDIIASARDLDRLSLKAVCRKYVVRMEKMMLERALAHTGWHRKKAARMLGISYKSLLNKIKEYQLA